MLAGECSHALSVSGSASFVHAASPLLISSAQEPHIGGLHGHKVTAFNKLVKAQDIPAVSIKTAPPPVADQP
jgi:hypothetical protein